MSGSYVKIKLDEKLLNPFLVDVTNTSAKRAAQRARDRARENITRAGRVDTGRMRDSIRIHVTRTDPKGSEYTIGSEVPYTSFQEEGIGPVYPVRARVLRFKPKGSSVFIFRPRTKGFLGAHFLRDALRSVTLRDFEP